MIQLQIPLSYLIIHQDIGYHLIPLNDLSKNQIFELTGLCDQGIIRALDRRWSVPFLNPPDEIFEKLKLICNSYNVHVFKGNRMSHLLSSEIHKGQAVNKLKVFLSEGITSISCGIFLSNSFPNCP